MKLYPRLFLAHAWVIVLGTAVLLLLSELFASTFIRHHVEQMVSLIGPAGETLRPDLEKGMRQTLTWTLLSALPFSLLIAALTAALAARGVVGRVRRLEAGSKALARGEYALRLETTGSDELSDLARSFNTLGAGLQWVEQGRVNLIGNVAHELRSPLSALRGYVEALEDGILPPERVITSLERELAAMERLVRDLSLVSKVEGGQLELHLKVVRVNEVLKAALERFLPAFEAREVQLSARAGFPLESSLQDIWADPERVNQILSNLLSNALRHTPAGGQVKLEATLEGSNTVAVRVFDSGEGLPPEALERVFERFYRGDSARVRGAGSGIGLTVARGLARAMGGDLSVVSQLGVGSTFTLTLPCAPESAVLTPTSEGSRSSVGHAGVGSSSERGKGLG